MCRSCIPLARPILKGSFIGCAFQLTLCSGASRLFHLNRHQAYRVWPGTGWGLIRGFLLASFVNSSSCPPPRLAAERISSTETDKVAFERTMTVDRSKFWPWFYVLFGRIKSKAQSFSVNSFRIVTPSLSAVRLSSLKYLFYLQLMQNFVMAQIDNFFVIILEGLLDMITSSTCMHLNGYNIRHIHLIYHDSKDSICTAFDVAALTAALPLKLSTINGDIQRTEIDAFLLCHFHLRLQPALDVADMSPFICNDTEYLPFLVKLLQWSDDLMLLQSSVQWLVLSRVVT